MTAQTKNGSANTRSARESGQKSAEASETLPEAARRRNQSAAQEIVQEREGSGENRHPGPEDQVATDSTPAINHTREWSSSSWFRLTKTTYRPKSFSSFPDFKSRTRQSGRLSAPSPGRIREARGVCRALSATAHRGSLVQLSFMLLN